MALLETALGAVTGGAMRMVPELMKVWDRRNERKHELSMQDKALAFEQLRGANRLEEIKAEGEQQYDQSALSALIESVKAQGRTVGGWVDKLTQSVRPGITYAYFGMYLVVRITVITYAIVTDANMEQIIKVAWTAEDQAMLAGILNFWFLGRVFDKAGR